MANAAWLYAGETPALTNPDDPEVLDPQDDALFLAGATAAVPVFWLFCFAQADFVAEGAPDGPSDTFVTELATARRRLAERDGLARDRFPRHVAVWDRWRRLIDAVPRRYLKLDPADIRAMDKDPMVLTAQLSDAVDWFEFGNASEFAEMLSLAGVRAYDPVARSFEAAAGMSPETCLTGWLERGARKFLSE